MLNDVNEWLSLHRNMNYPIALSDNDAFKYAIAYLGGDILFVKKRLIDIFTYTYPFESINYLLKDNIYEIESIYSNNIHSLETSDFDIFFYDEYKNAKKINFEYFINNKKMIINSQIMNLIKSDIAIQMEKNKKLSFIQIYKNHIRDTLINITTVKLNRIFHSICYCKLLMGLTVHNNFTEDLELDAVLNILQNHLNHIEDIWTKVFINKEFINYSLIATDTNSTIELKNVLGCLEGKFSNLYDLTTVNINTTI